VLANISKGRYPRSSKELDRDAGEVDLFGGKHTREGEGRGGKGRGGEGRPKEILTASQKTRERSNEVESLFREFPAHRFSQKLKSVSTGVRLPGKERFSICVAEVCMWSLVAKLSYGTCFFK
jgi:hypothetical protein